ncbi:hypothetical protein LJR153_001531 [Paenibacillus sp. LjRoot153]
MPSIGPIGNFDLVKKIDIEHALSTILQYRPLSRAKIASLTGLNKIITTSERMSLISAPICRSETISLCGLS